MTEIIESSEQPVGYEDGAPVIRDTIGVTIVDLKLKVFYDGTNTIADVVATRPHRFGGPDRETVLATGEARRKHGDPRNQTIGDTLATARALRNLAAAQEADAAALLA